MPEGNADFQADHSSVKTYNYGDVLTSLQTLEDESGKQDFAFPTAQVAEGQNWCHCQLESDTPKTCCYKHRQQLPAWAPLE